jgi:MFS family permease
MDRRKDIAAVYTAGLIQGIALMTFPAASTIFTDPQVFGLSNTDYGSLFIPQAILSIAASLLSMKLNRRFGSKWVYFLGLIFNFISMTLLAFTPLALHDPSLAYGMLLTATGCLGVGFGLTVPTLNTLAALLYPNKVDSTLLILNALLGVGTALAPALIVMFTHLGAWWGLPILLAISIALLLLLSSPLTLPGGRIETHLLRSKDLLIPRRFWIFAAFALLYGVIETLNSNWGPIYMREHEQAALPIQSLALGTFWGMVTIGRIFFAWISKKLNTSYVYQGLPFIAAIALIMITALPFHNEYLGVTAFGLAGFGCSALLPLTISFGSKQLESIATSIAGGIIAFYLLGYGIAAYGVGPLQEMAHLSLSAIYEIGAAIALVLGVLASLIVKKEYIERTTEEEKI